MADLVPAATQPAPPPPLSALSPAGGNWQTRARELMQQPAVRKALPWFAGITSVGMAALLWSSLSPAPQRILYGSLNDSERAEVVATLDQAGISYRIDNNTGALSVGEDDLYRARMMVASNGSLATPETGADLLSSLPMGASRTLEGDRLRAAQERDLMLTIQEIDGVEAVRVHLARAERSVFVRDDLPPSASVMVRMARGRQLSEAQVRAIANLVAGSVPGLAIEAVRIVDQHGRLLSEPQATESGALELQARMEAKLRTQIDQLLTPMVGEGNFSSEIQVRLNMDEVTSARESYDKDGVVRRESTQSSTSTDPAATGVPGATTNTPPPAAQAVNGAPQGTPAGAASQNGEQSASRTYELGREVSVSNALPGSVERLTVAVALNQTALKNLKPADLKKFEDLVGAAVGIDPRRGDSVNVMVRPFETVEATDMPFWETSWFAMLVRNGVALIGVVLLLLLVARPIVRAITGKKDDEQEDASSEPGDSAARIALAGNATTAGPGREQLAAQLELAQRIVREQPDDALLALRRMLQEGPEGEQVA